MRLWGSWNKTIIHLILFSADDFDGELFRGLKFLSSILRFQIMRFSDSSNHLNF